MTRAALRLVIWVALCLVGCAPALASHLVTGNGFGTAVIAPEQGALTKFYPHPYSFVRPDPRDPLSEGIATANFITSLGWGTASGGTADYIAQSHVIRLRHAGRSATAFMPFGLDRPALIIGGDGIDWRARWATPVASQHAIGTATLLTFKGTDEALLLIPLATAKRSPASRALGGSTAWALVALERPEEATAALADVTRWRAGLRYNALVTRELADFEAWRVRPTVTFRSTAERNLWRQSETMLRIAQSREPNRPGRYGNGLIVAALPDVYSTPWVRDMAWATMALIRMGHRAEARAAVLAYFNARPTGRMRTAVGGHDYQVSVVRYFGDGTEEPFFTQEGSTNIEFDNWGEVLWVLGAYLDRFGDDGLLGERTYRGRLYDSARDFIVAPLFANSEPFAGGRIVAADTSIWEEKQKDAKHFAFSTALAITGLKAFADVARRAGDVPAQRQALANAARLQIGFDAAFVRGGKLRGTLEDGIKNDIDGALLPIINLGVVTDPKVIADVIDRMRLLKVASGGYRRVHGTYTDPKIFEYWYEQEEFLFVDFALSELLRHRGQAEVGDAILARIVANSAADHDIIPEMYVAVPCDLFPGKIGDPTGALPMVGYGAGTYILHLIDRERAGR